MFNKSTYSPPGISFSFCLWDGLARNRSSAFQAAALSISVVIAVLSPVAMAGNALVLAAIWRTASLRTPSYIILCGLAFTDFCTGLVTQPFFVAFQLICLEEGSENNQISLLVFATAGTVLYFINTNTCNTYGNRKMAAHDSSIIADCAPKLFYRGTSLSSSDTNCINSRRVVLFRLQCYFFRVFAC